MTPITKRFLIGTDSEGRFDWCTSFFIFAIVLMSSTKKMISQSAQRQMKTWETLNPKNNIVGSWGKIAHAINEISRINSPKITKIWDTLNSRRKCIKSQISIGVHRKMMGIKWQHSKEKYASDSSLIIDLKQFRRHIHNLNAWYRVIQMVQIIHCHVE